VVNLNPVGTAPDAHSVVEGIDATLEAFLSAESAVLLSTDPALEPLLSTARSAVLDGGKRMRPTFAYWGWRGAAGGDRPVEPILPALAALELLHAFALVHDDLMDRSDLRRGHPTAHRRLAGLHRERRLRGDPDHFGASAAILVGDLCLVWADRLMAASALDPATLGGARASYDAMRVEAVAGQFLDVLGESSTAWSVEDALRTVRLKTASYTVIHPLLFGAALAGTVDAQAPLTRSYQQYGLAVGEAFQLRDDLLGVYGAPGVTGKGTAEDLVRGKPTVLLQMARRLASPRQAVRLEQLVRAGDPAGLPALADLIRQTGATAFIERRIAVRTRQAICTVEGAPLAAPVTAALVELARAAATRDS
jgi:geranylgeranyl diphosphate synthase type I